MGTRRVVVEPERQFVAEATTGPAAALSKEGRLTRVGTTRAKSCVGRNA